MSPRAIGAIVSARGPRGTAFAVTRDRLVTCWHCLADPRDATTLDTPTVAVQLAPGTTIEARYRAHDARLDVAVMDVDAQTPLPPDWSPLPFGRDADIARDAPVQAIGWAVHNPSKREPQTMPAQVSLPHTTIRDGEPVVALYSDQVAAGLRARGFSGGPVLLETADGERVIGVVRWQQNDPDDPEQAVGGTVYATGPDAITALWPDLAEKRDFIDDLCGDASAPGRRAIRAIAEASLRGAGGPLPFAGRDAELAGLDEWLRAPDGSPYYLVTGAAGMGKSSLMARWSGSLVAADHPALHVVFVPISARYEMTSKRAVMMALLHRVARVHGSRYDRSADADGARDELDGLLRRPVPDGHTLLVVVDALDEAGGWTPGPLDFPRQPGSGVRIVLSARHTQARPTGSAWSAALGLPPGTGSRRLEALGPSDLVVLVRQVVGSDRGADARAVEIVGSRLFELTGGEPVTTSLYLADLASAPDRDPEAWVSAVGSARPGLEGWFEGWWRDQEGLWQASRPEMLADADRLLGLLAVAEAPLRFTELTPLLGRLPEPMDGARLRRAVELVDRLVLPGAHPDSVAVAHPIIGTMLRARLRRYGDLDNYREAFRGWGDDTLDRLFAHELPPREVSPYLSRHLASHLLPDSPEDIAPHTPAAVKRAFRVVDTLWRQAREAVSEDVDGYRQDVTRVVEASMQLNRAAFARRELLPCLPEWVGGTAELAGEQAVLSEEVTPQLAGELVRHRLWLPSRGISFLSRFTRPESVSRSRARGVAAIAAHIDPEDLPALSQLQRSVDTEYVPEPIVLATSAVARRLIDLRRPSEAIALAGWLPDGHRRRDVVQLGVLAELIPLLPRPDARAALDTAMDLAGRDTILGAQWLTTHVPLELAEELWPGAARSLTQRLVDRGYWLRTHRDLPYLQARNVDFNRLDLGDSWYWDVDGPAFTAAARWMPDDQRSQIILAVLESMPAVPPDSDGMRSVKQALVPNFDCEGILGALPSGDAPHAVSLVARHLDGRDRAACLLQLLPKLTTEERDVVADVVFDADELSELEPVVVRTVAPAVVEAGLADLLLDLVAADRLANADSWVERMAPLLSRDEALHALTAAGGISTEWKQSSCRRAAAARLASFGAADASTVLEAAYRRFGNDGMPPPLIARLRRVLPSPEESPNGGAGYRAPWWERIPYPGVRRKRDSGVLGYPSRRPDQARTPAPAGRKADHDLSHPQDVIEFAYLMGASLSSEQVPALLLLAKDFERWVALTVLAAGTYLPGDGFDVVLSAIISRLGRLEEAALAMASEQAAVDGFPIDSPWLVRGFEPWTPHFVRLLSPAARPAVRAALFHDGYLDGVLRRHEAFGDAHERLDDWAADVLSIVPILDRDQVFELVTLCEKKSRSGIRSETTRKTLEASLGVRCIELGEPDAGYALISGADWQDETIRRSALGDVVTQIDASQIPRWMAEVHRILAVQEDRSELWAVLHDRWPELSRDQLWEVTTHLAEMARHGDRTDFYADLVHYNHALHELAGTAEVTRLLSLVDAG